MYQTIKYHAAAAPAEPEAARRHKDEAPRRVGTASDTAVAGSEVAEAVVRWWHSRLRLPGVVRVPADRTGLWLQWSKSG